MSKLIALDAGHEWDTAGKRTPKFSDGTYMNEWTFNEAVRVLLDSELKRHGFRTVNVNPDRGETSLAKRVETANNAKADLYVSIHANAMTGKWGNAQGIETFTWPSGDSLRVGKLVHKYLVQGTSLSDRGVKNGDWLYVIKNTKMPAILVECGFMDNLREAKLLLTAAYRKECAVEICKGICEAYGVKYKAESAPAPAKKPAPAAPKPSTSPSKKQEFVEVLAHSLWTYGSKNWKDKEITVSKGEVFTVIGTYTVAGSKMYQIKSGLYITANPKYVRHYSR